jgi:hypothetical protein
MAGRFVARLSATLAALLLALLPAAAGAAFPSAADGSGPGVCLVPKATMDVELRARLSPRAVCRDFKLPPPSARPVEVTAQDAPSAAGRVSVEYTSVRSANAWLTQGWAIQNKP